MFTTFVIAFRHAINFQMFLMEIYLKTTKLLVIIAKFLVRSRSTFSIVTLKFTVMLTSLLFIVLCRLLNSLKLKNPQKTPFMARAT